VRRSPQGEGRAGGPKAALMSVSGGFADRLSEPLMLARRLAARSPVLLCHWDRKMLAGWGVVRCQLVFVHLLGT